MTELTGCDLETRVLETRVNVLAEELEEIRDDLQKGKLALAETQDWLDNAAAGESRGGFTASRPERWRMESRLRTLRDMVARDERLLDSVQKEYDAAWAKLPADAFGDDDNDDNE
jgi:chromosome segregation ATPase